MKILKYILIVFLTIPLFANAQFIIQKPSGGGTGIGSVTAGDVGKSIRILDDSPFTYELYTPSSGGSSAYEIATTSTISISNLLYFTKTGGLTTVSGIATTSVTAGSGISFTSFTAIGSAPITIECTGCSGTPVPNVTILTQSGTTYNQASTTGRAWFFGNGFVSNASSTFSGALRLGSLSQGFLYVGSTGLVNTAATSTILSEYVPYTGATQTVNLGSNDFTTTGGLSVGSGEIDADGGGGLFFKSADGGTSYVTVYSTGVSGQLKIQSDGIGFGATLDASSISGTDKTFTWPNKSGTPALINNETFTGLTTMAYSSSTAYSSFQVASSTKWVGGGLSTCDPTTGKLTWDSTFLQFGCGTDFNTGGIGSSPYDVATRTDIAVPGVAYFTKVGGITTLGSVATGTVSVGSSAITVTAGRSVLGGGLVIDCATSSSGQNGCLSSTDWSTFNSKQATIGVTWPITLSGTTLGFNGLSTTTALTTGRVPYVSGVNTFADVATSTPTVTSPITYSGTLGNFVGGSSGAFACATCITTSSILDNLSQTNLADPGSDQLVFWDDSDTEFDFISTISGGSISGNTLTITASGGSSAYEIATTSTIAVPGLAYFTKTAGLTTLGSVATTTLTGTAPIVFSQPISVIGSSASAISCTSASTSVTGCLTSGDWNIFNNKANSKWATSTDTYGIYPALAGLVSIGTTTSRLWPLTIASSTVPQLSLGDGIAGNPQWTFRTAGGNLYLSTTTAQGLATSTPAAFTICGLSPCVPAIVLGTSTPSSVSNGMLVLGTNTTNGTTTIMMGKIQWDGYNSAGSRICSYINSGNTLSVQSGACTQ